MSENSQQDTDQKVHSPEFVLVDEDIKEDVKGGTFHYHSSQYYESLNKISDIRPSIAIRIACVVAWFFIVFGTAFVSACFLLSLAGVIMTLGFVKRVNRVCYRYWDILKKMCATTLGLFIGIFSPAFGLGVIILYFILTTGGTNDPLFSKFFESRLYTSSFKK